MVAWSYAWSYGDDKLWWHDTEMISCDGMVVVWHGHTEMISCGGMVIRR